MSLIIGICEGTRMEENVFGSYQEHSEIPAYEVAKWDNDTLLNERPGPLLWSAAIPPPPVGARIIAKINNCGPAIVTGYFTQDGWLGLICELTDPPEWFVRQNGANRRGHVFGPEFRMEEEEESA